MAILSSEILSFVNGRLERNETDIDESIKLVLRDLASYFVLEDEDTSQSLTSSSTSLSFPSDCLDGEQAIKSVTLTDASSVQLAPLDFLPGGWREYERLLDEYNDGERSRPEWCVVHNRTIYLWPLPNASYTSSIWYYKRHADSVSSIEFSEDWRNTLYFGACMEVAIHMKMPDMVTLYSSRYMAERDAMISTHRDKPAIVE